MSFLNTYQTFFWDFDGVILESNAVREYGFRKVLEHFGDPQVEQLIDFHRKNGGWSRYVKFRYFFEEILGKPISEQEVNTLADSFSQIMLEELVNPKNLIEETLLFIRQQAIKTPMYIVSGSDQTELRSLCKALKIDHYFKGIFGSPTPKIQLVQDIIAQHPEIRKAPACLIGDAENDWDAAQKNNLDFIGYNNSALKNLGVYYVESFKNEL